MVLKDLVKKCILVSFAVFHVMLFAQVTQEWVTFYNGPMNREDCGYAIAVSNTDNVYVAGYSYDIGPQFPKALLIKYDSSGNEKWFFRYDTIPSQFADILLDNAENTYIVGTCITSDSFLTMKFDSLGNCLWNVKYGPNGGSPGGRAIAIDSSGNIYITGGFYSPISDWDMITIKYDNSGNELWVRQYDYEGMDDYAFDIVCDDHGSVYITGTFQGMTIGTGYGTVKYDSLGNEVWAKYYDGQLGGGWAQAIDIDNSGNVYVTGHHEDTISATSHFDYATVKYDGDGNELWARRYNGTGNSDDRANAIVVDELGTVYITGYSRGATSGDDIVTIGYDTDGTEQWIVRHVPSYPQGWASSDNGWDITLDSVGNIYVAGEVDTDSAGSTYWDFCTIKYDNMGNELWAMTYNGSSNLSDGAYAIAVNNSNVYVTGYSWIVAGDWDCTTIKYSQTVSCWERKVDKENMHCSIVAAPNPFRETTNISFGPGHPDRIIRSSYGTGSLENVELKIYSVTGRLVKDFSCLMPYAQRPTYISWYGTDESGQSVPAGVYIIQLETQEQTITEKIVKLR